MVTGNRLSFSRLLSIKHGYNTSDACDSLTAGETEE